MEEESKVPSCSTCCICFTEVESRAVVCPEGHVTCHDDLDGLMGYLSAPEQLRRHRGMVPCPWVGEDGQCQHKWDYRDIHGHLGDVARVRYTEAALGLVNMLLEGSTDRQPPSEGPAMALGGQGLDAEVEEVVSEVMSSILNLRCPACRTVFYDFEACCAVTCAACGVCFCALCFVSATDAADTHIHLVGKHGDLYFPAEEVQSHQNAYRSDNLLAFLKSLGRDQRSLAYQVLDRIRAACSDVGLDLGPIHDELRVFYGGPREVSDNARAPAVVVASAAALVRRRSTEELRIDDILGTIGRFDPGDNVRIVDTMGLTLGRGRAVATCTGSRLLAGGDDDDDDDDDDDNILVLNDVLHLGPSRTTDTARPRSRHRPPRLLPPLIPPVDAAAAASSSPAAAGRLRRPPSLSLGPVGRGSSPFLTPAPPLPSPPWTFDVTGHDAAGGASAAAAVIKPPQHTVPVPAAAARAAPAGGAAASSGFAPPLGRRHLPSRAVTAFSFSPVDGDDDSDGSLVSLCLDATGGSASPLYTKSDAASTGSLSPQHAPQARLLPASLTQRRMLVSSRGGAVGQQDGGAGEEKGSRSFFP